MGGKGESRAASEGDIEPLIGRAAPGRAAGPAVLAAALLLGGLGALLAGCGAAAGPTAAAPGALRVVAVETFLADITRNVAGEHATVEALMPTGADPHAFQPSPAQLRALADADLVVFAGAGLEPVLGPLLAEAAGGRAVVAAGEGIVAGPRPAGAVPVRSLGAAPVPSLGAAPVRSLGAAPVRSLGADPHVWLDPVLAPALVDKVAQGLAEADPARAADYAANAAAYKERLRSLDAEIRRLLAPIPAADRKLVTLHAELGYFAERYDLQVVGTVLPGFSSDAAPSARHLARLVDKIRASGAKAVFLEAGANPRLARQVAEEAGIPVVEGLYTHSLSDPAGPAPTYLDMLRHDAALIAATLAP
jgi:ABC-type Zn uptake system ZnuABC Zn-binding protein ZnuA